jgi:hypothetical protein
MAEASVGYISVHEQSIVPTYRMEPRNDVAAYFETRCCIARWRQRLLADDFTGHAHK